MKKYLYTKINVKYGDRYERLTVIREVERSKHRKRRFECQCDCGGVKVFNLMDLRSGNTKSCGCFNLERSTKHGLKDHYLYTIWSDIKQRTLNPNSKAYPNYGERGITIHPGWINDFNASHNYIIRNLGDRLSNKYSLDRVENNGSYEPGNLRWANNSEQLRNSRIATPCKINQVCYDSLAEAVETTRIAKSTIRNRLNSDNFPNYIWLRNPYL